MGCICHQCGKECTTIHHLKTHVESVHDKIRNFTCEICNQSFYNKYKLDFHMHKHSDIRNFHCNECGKSFKTRADLFQHYEIHDKGKIFTCQECAEQYNKRSTYFHHLRKHEKLEQKQGIRLQPGSGTSALVCDSCNKSFSDLSHLRRHIKSVHERVYKFFCETCNKGFVRKDSYKTHRVSHLKPDNGPNGRGKQEATLKCKLCDNLYVTAGALRVHTRRIHDGLGPEPRKYGCEICGQMFHRTKGLEEHVRAKHEGKKDFFCEYCNLPFAWNKSLERHNNQNHLQNSCDECIETFFTCQELIDHQKSKHQAPPINCKICKLEFPKLDLLLKHSANMENIGVCYHLQTMMKPKFICDCCNEDFTCKNKLEKHLKDHKKKLAKVEQVFVDGVDRKNELPNSSKKRISKSGSIPEVPRKRFRRTKSEMRAALLKLEETEETEEALIEISDSTHLKNLPKEEPIFLNNEIKEDPDSEFIGMPDFPVDLDILSFVSLEPEVVVKEEPDLEINTYKQVSFNFFDSCDELKTDESEEECNLKDENFDQVPSSSRKLNSPKSKKIKNIPNIGDLEKFHKPKKTRYVDESDEEIPNKRQTFECEFCKQIFLHERSLTHHLALKHPTDGTLPPKPLKKPHVCSICNVVRSHSRENIRRHIESVHEKKRAYHCKPCNISFGWERSLRNHNEHFHAKVGQPADIKFACKYCDMEFDSTPKLLQHQKKIHDLSISTGNHFECTLCNTRFSSLKNLQKHHQQKHSDIPASELQLFKCHHCELTFETTDLMIQHMVEKHEYEKKFNCEICQSFFGWKTGLTRHHRANHAPSPCSVCSEVFVGQKLLSEHMALVHECNLDLECQLCEVKCSTFVAMQRHNLMDHPNSKRAFCEKCTEIFSSRDRLKSHAASTHGQNLKNDCLMCQDSFHCKTTLDEHHQKVHDFQERNFACDQCDRTYRRRPDLLVHQRDRHHRTKDVKCEICEELFMRRAQLQRHSQVVHNFGKKLTRTCGVCSYTCTLAKDFAGHIALHADHFICFICGSHFSQEIQLKHHNISHRKIDDKLKKIVCDLCGLKYTSRSCLLVHMKQHTGDRQYTCDECGKSYKFPSALHVHRKYHQKKLECHYCQQLFATKSVLETHINIHEGKKPYCCDLCDYRCNQPGSLKIHQRKHTGEKLYKCSMCPQDYAFHKSLKAHLLKEHGIFLENVGRGNRLMSNLPTINN